MSKFIIENNLRKVIPYYINIETHVKGRWEGKTLIEVFKSDFGISEQDVLEDIKNEKLYVISNINKPNEKACLKGFDLLISRPLHAKDLVCHSKHRHEPPIPYLGRIKSVYEDDELLVVDKPSGVPTHPTGNYYFNSVSEMVKDQFGLEAIWTCHRLDKVTSGVLIFGKTKSAGLKFLRLIKDHKDQTEKTYLARVVGEFPNGKLQYNCPIFAVNLNGYLVPGNSEELPLDSTTIFQKVSYNASLNQSLVKCIPITGKFHQIRIHLRNLGFPIANDSFYRGDNELTNRRCSIEEELYKKLFQKYPEFKTFGTTRREGFINIDLLDEKLQYGLDELKRDHLQSLNEQKLSYCEECHRLLFDDDYRLNPNIWLHALSFSYGEYRFVTEYPGWANI